MGNQSTRRRIFAGISPSRWSTRCRSKILFRSTQPTSENFWQSTNNFWIRPRRVQCLQYQESKKTRCNKCWHCSHWKNSLGSQRDTSQKYSARAGPGGGGNWNDQVFSLWIQQTECKEHCGNGSVRPACDFGLQYEEIDEGVVVHAVSSGNELIRFTRPMRRMSRGDEKRDGTAGQKLTMFRK